MAIAAPTKNAPPTIAPSIPLVAIAPGDGIGPEIMDATLRIFEAAGASMRTTSLELGEAAYLSGHSSGIAPHVWDQLAEADVLLKGPITTPLGSGYKSLNVTLRKTLGLFANVRPCRALSPAIATQHPDMDIVIVRENEEDLYAGIEHRQTQDVYQCLKLVSRPGCERIVRYAFDYARTNGRKKVTCMTKSNIMKLTDGLFQQVFEEIGAEYPDLEQDHMIIDIGSARLASQPDQFDVIVTSNLYGDIISDIASELTGSVGLGASVNIGDELSMFEAIHGSAPDIAGQNIANPSGLILAGISMLTHLGQTKVAEKVHNAWLCTVESGMHTADIFDAKQSHAKLGTEEFADTVIERLGQEPTLLAPVNYAADAPKIATAAPAKQPPAQRTLVGVDVFVCSDLTPDEVAASLHQAVGSFVPLAMITNRGVKVWPNGNPATFCTDHWRCRFQPVGGRALNHAMIAELLRRLSSAGIDFVKTEQLYTFDGQAGYSLGQGQ